MTRRMLSIGGALVAASLALAACGSEEPTPTATGETRSSTPAVPTTVGTDEHNSADVMFAMMMIPHHAQAVEMSDLVLAKDDTDEAVRALAEQIKAAQAPEIEQMTAWLEGWGVDVAHTELDMGAMGHGMSGMLSAEEMDALADAPASGSNRLYLELMIEHHEGAIEMAEVEVANGKSPQAIALAEAIITAQQAEIAVMEDLLARS